MIYKLLKFLLNNNLEQNNTIFNYYETNQSLGNNIQTPIYSYTAKEDGEILNIIYGMCVFNNNIMHIMYYVLNNEFIRCRDVAVYKSGGDVITNSNSCKIKLSKGDNVKIICLSNHASNIYWYIDTNRKNEL